MKRAFNVLLITLMLYGTLSAGSAYFGNVQAATPFGGIISADTTWTQTDSPYTLTGAVGILNGATLTIEPGVTVNLGNYYIQVNGTLRAQGSGASPIQFNDGTSSTTSGAGILFTASTSGGIIENAILNHTNLQIEGASPKISSCSFNSRITTLTGSPQINSNRFIGGDGLVLYDSNAVISNNVFTNNYQAIYVGSSQFYSSPTIEHNLIADNTYGIMMPVSATFNPTIRNNTIANNTEGISIWNGGVPLPTIQYNNIYGNSKYNLHLTNIKVNIDASLNWWGTTDEGAISPSILDFNDDFNLGNVTFKPYLTESNPQAMPDASVTAQLPPQNPTETPQPTAESTVQPSSTPDASKFNIESNSTVTEFSFNSTIPQLTFTVSGPNGTTGYVKATISKDFMPSADNIKVYLDGNRTDCTVDSSGTSWIVMFTYHHSTHHVAITGSGGTSEAEAFPSWVWYTAAGAVAVGLIAAVVLLVWLTSVKAKETV